jgi:hypothetical protein
MVAPSTHVSLILTTNNYKKKKIECAAFENIHRVFVYTCKCNTSRVISAYLHVGTKVMLISLVDY